MDRRRVGRSLRAIRRRRRWRQQDVADHAGCARSVVAAAEAGQLGRMTLDRLTAIADALGADLDLLVRWHGERLDRLLDEGHAQLVEATMRRLSPAGWGCEVEATYSIWGERGSIDVLAHREDAGVVLVVEVKTAFGDLQATASTFDRKLRLAPVLARERAWTAASVAGLLVVADTRTNRRVVERHAETFDRLVPRRGRTASRWLAAPDRTGPRMLVFLSSVGGADVRQRSRIARPADRRREPGVRHRTGTNVGRGDA